MPGRLVVLLVALSMLASCATRPAGEVASTVPPRAAGGTEERVARPPQRPSEGAMLAGSFASGAVLILIAVAAIAGSASLVFQSDP